MANEYDLLIEPIIISKNKRILLVFKPKEIIENSVVDLRFRITNKGGNSFKGGTLKNIKIAHPNAEIVTFLDDKKIPIIPSQEDREIQIGKCLLFSSGAVIFSCKIDSDTPNSKINYYQKDKLDNEKSELLESGQWLDFITITSRYEINQRYTNYLLSVMTLLLLAFTCIQVFMIARPFFC